MRFLTILIFVTSLFCADFDWIPLEKAKEISKRENKPIMIMVSSKDCGVCGYMEDVVFEDERVAEYVENFFVPVKISLKEAEKLRLKAFGTPTFFFVNAELKPYKRALVGAAKADVFLKKLKEYKRAAN